MEVVPVSCKRPCFNMVSMVWTFAVVFFSLASAASSTAVAPAAAVPAVAPVPAPAPALKLLTAHEKVVGSLRSAGNYGAVAGLLDSFPNSIIKAGMTLFAPNDNAFSNVRMNSTTYLQTLLSYHASTQVYSYQALLNLPVGSKVQTSAADVVIVVTSATKGAYKVDDSTVVDPDIFADQTISVQGIDTVLNTAKYNKGVVAPEAAPAPITTVTSPPPVVIAPPGSDSGTPGAPGADTSDGPSSSDEPSSSSSQTTDKNDAASHRNLDIFSTIPTLMAFWALWMLVQLAGHDLSS